jgi:hypothetical protein
VIQICIHICFREETCYEGHEMLTTEGNIVMAMLHGDGYQTTVPFYVCVYVCMYVCMYVVK